MKKWGTALALNNDNLSFPLRFEGSASFIVGYEAAFEAYASAESTLAEARESIMLHFNEMTTGLLAKYKSDPLFFINSYRKTIKLAAFDADDSSDTVSVILIVIFAIVLAAIVIVGIIFYNRKRRAMLEEQQNRLNEIAESR